MLARVGSSGPHQARPSPLVVGFRGGLVRTSKRYRDNQGSRTWGLQAVAIYQLVQNKLSVLTSVLSAAEHFPFSVLKQCEAVQPLVRLWP